MCVQMSWLWVDFGVTITKQWKWLNLKFLVVADNKADWQYDGRSMMATKCSLHSNQSFEFCHILCVFQCFVPAWSRAGRVIVGLLGFIPTNYQSEISHCLIFLFFASSENKKNTLNFWYLFWERCCIDFSSTLVWLEILRIHKNKTVSGSISSNSQDNVKIILLKIFKSIR